LGQPFFYHLAIDLFALFFSIHSSNITIIGGFHIRLPFLFSNFQKYSSSYPINMISQTRREAWRLNYKYVGQ